MKRSRRDRLSGTKDRGALSIGLSGGSRDLAGCTWRAEGSAGCCIIRYAILEEVPDRGESNLRALCDVRDAAELARLAARRVVLMV